MTANTKIEWADHTFNPWIGCTRVSPGCDNCYAAAQDKFRHWTPEGWGGPRRRTSPSNWKQPHRWEAQHAQFYAQHGRRQRVFCASLADVFDNQVPDEWFHDLMVVIQQTPNLDWLLLTKRPQNIVRRVNECGAVAGNGTRYLPINAQLGTSAEDQKRADLNIPALCKAKETLGVRVAFVSFEPLLGPVDLTQIDDGTAHRDVPREEWGSADDEESPPGLWWNVLTGDRTIMHGGATGDWSRTDSKLDWVIVGGESGHQARPMSIQWARILRDQCSAAGVPFLFKQWGEWAPAWPRPAGTPGHFAYGDWRNGAWGGRAFAETDQYPRAFTSFGARAIVERVGKKAAGRLLDGREWNEVPSC